MSKLNERISYLRGLADGMKITADTDEHKLLLGILDALTDMAAEIDDQADYLQEIDDDLGQVEDVLFADEEEEWDEEDEEDDEEEWDEDEEAEDDAEDEDDPIVEYDCPCCGKRFKIGSNDLFNADDARCPECGGLLFPELS